MFQSLTSKTKFHLLIGTGILFTLLIYQLGLRNTIVEYSRFRELSGKVKQADLAPQEVTAMESELSRINKMTTSYNRSGVGAQASLLQLVSEFSNANGLTIKDFPKTIENRIDNYTIEQNKITVEGNFFNALRLVYLLEQEQAMGQVVSANFEAVIDKSTKKTFLQTTFFIQKIRDNE